MNFTIRYTQRAKDDIIRNADWWAEHHSYDQAIAWKNAVRDQIRTLQTMPERHALAPENPRCSYDLWQKLVGLGKQTSYRAVYTIQEDVVVIIAVRRAAEDELRSEDLIVELDG